LTEIKLKYLIAVLCIVVILGVVLTAVVFSEKEIKTNHFQKDEISFDYPNTWLTTNQTQNTELVGFTDPKSDLNISVNKQPIPPDYKISDNFTISIPENQSGFKFISHKSLKLNGNTVQKDVYQFNNSSLKRTELWINKNDAMYSIIYTTNNTNLDENSPEIKALTQNLTINNATVPNTNTCGELSLPTLGQNWTIVEDSVNHYGSVYHYSDSFYPGQNGTIGFLGHHTRYSSPFDNINQLQVGDPVIITDYITQKKYVYKVTNNGDIKADYKTNPIQFPAGSFSLTLVTCYPPGFQEAAYMTHLSLVSVEPI